MGSKTGKKKAILSLFFETLKNDHFWPFFVCWRVLTISWRADNKFWWWDDVNDVLMMASMRKKVVWGQKNDEKSTLQQDPKNLPKMEPGTGGEEPRSGRVQGAFMTRSREAELVRHPFEQKSAEKKKKTWNGTSSASVAMCEAFFDACAAYSQERLVAHVGLMKAGACERSEVRAGITKVREDFFDMKFHDGTQIMNRHTRP
jgi:hypothetical protein